MGQAPQCPQDMGATCHISKSLAAELPPPWPSSLQVTPRHQLLPGCVFKSVLLNISGIYTEKLSVLGSTSAPLAPRGCE